MSISDDFLYQLRLGNPIENVVEKYLQIKRRGHLYTGLCPFHSEKTPSFTVYQDTQSFYCFGCGAGGDVISFVMKIENLEYIEAVKLLAENAGLTLPDDKTTDNISRSKLKILEINRESAIFFYKSLTNDLSKKGLIYLKSRGLSAETVKKYKIGYANDSWDSLYKHLKSLNYDDKEIIESCVCKKTKTGYFVDFFRDRIIFPIIDLRGNIIAFGGRLLSGDGPKYINTSDTLVFKKSRNLFSMNFAKNSASTKMILAEGYMDVITINQAGFENVVATLGTALTSEQAILISHYSKEVIIAYDSDVAGQNATHKAINLLSNVGITTKILNLKDTKDPDEFIKKYGATRFKLILENSDGAINFEIEKCKENLDIASDIGKIEFLKKATKILANINNPLERDVYISKVAKESEFHYDVLKLQVNNEIKKNNNIDKKKQWQSMASRMNYRDEINPESKMYPQESKAEELIIAYLLKNLDMYNKITSMITENDFITTFNKKVYTAICDKIKNSTLFTLSLLTGDFSEKELGRIYGIDAKTRDFILTEKTLTDCINVLKKSKLTNNIDLNSDDALLKLQENLKHK